MTMEFISLFEEAGAEAESQQYERSLAKASAAAASVWPFLSLARTERDFGHRLAMCEDRLSTIASDNDITLEDLTRQYKTAFLALAEQREQQHEASEHEASGNPRCGNCGHANPPHTRGGQCTACGCDSYQPRTRGGPRRASWGGPSECPYCGVGVHPSGEQTWRAAKEEHLQDCKGDRSQGVDKTKYHMLPQHRQSSFDQRIAQMRQALMEGQDPLEWVEQTAPPGPGQPEKPGGHTTQSEPYTYAEVPPGELNEPNLPPQQRQSARDYPMPSPGAAENPGGHSTAPEPYTYAEVPPGQPGGNPNIGAGEQQAQPQEQQGVCPNCQGAGCEQCMGRQGRRHPF